MDNGLKEFDEKQIRQPLESRTIIKNELIKLFKQGNVVLFIGSGLSANLRLPDWNQFADNYLDFLYYECNRDKIINYKTYTQLKDEDFKTVLSLCRNLHKNIDECDLKRKFIEWFGIDVHTEDLIGMEDDKKKEIMKLKEDSLEEIKKPNSIFRKVYELNEIFITTNYDDILDILVNEKNKEHSKEPDKIEDEKNKVFYKEEDFIIEPKNYKKAMYFISMEVLMKQII